MSNVFVFGATGLLGSAVAKANPNCIGTSSQDFDATNYADTQQWFNRYREQLENSIIHICCGKVAGIGGQIDYVMFLENMQMAINLITCANEFQKHGRTVYYSSSCVYPRHLDVFVESDMLTGEFEPSNEGYALAKAAGQRLCNYLNAYNGNTQFVTVVPPNLYGDNDNWNLETCHVLPALAQRIKAARDNKFPILEVWGNPDTRREFLRSDDIAQGAQFVIDHMQDAQAINIGAGEDISIGEIVQGLCERLNYKGDIVYTSDRVGKARKLLNSDTIHKQGWSPSYNYTDMLDYIAAAVEND
jgi:GDP-L-fucose synthase